MAAPSLWVSKRDLGRARKGLLCNREQSHAAPGMDKLTSQAFSITGPKQRMLLQLQLRPNGSCAEGVSLQIVQRIK